GADLRIGEPDVADELLGIARTRRFPAGGSRAASAAADRQAPGQRVRARLANAVVPVRCRCGGSRGLPAYLAGISGEHAPAGCRAASEKPDPVLFCRERSAWTSDSWRRDSARRR